MTESLSEVVYRPARREDFLEMSALIRSAFDGLLKERGFWDLSPFASSRLPPLSPSGPFPWFELGLKEDSDGFWVAEVGNVMAGFALSWVRGSLWYLAHLFVRPDQQGRDIGRNLMDRAMRHGKDSEIKNRALSTLAYNPVSISLYSRYGIYPREPLYWMEGPTENVKAINAASKLAVQRGENFQTVRETLTEIDTSCIGYPREKNHEFLFSLPTYKCYIYSLHDRPVGYAYVAQNGRVGPAATVSQDAFIPIIESALGLATREEKASSLSLNATGSNEELMKLAFSLGMKIRDNFLLMSSKPFSNISRYLLYPTGAML
jgi:ribosomal protein S18 acetylase RimI-like enzyme